jgi:uncharacterized repeat protein (TIGR01451 family)
VNLAITKTDGVDFYVPGTSTTYTIIATNAGPSFLANGKVVDALPPQVSTATWTATYSGVGSTGPASGSGPLNETISLAAGGTATFLFTVNIKSDATGDMTNTVTVSPPAGTIGQHGNRDRHQHGQADGEPRHHEDRRHRHLQVGWDDDLHDCAEEQRAD